MANKTNYYGSKPKEKKWVGKLVACVATGLAVVTAVCAIGVGTRGFQDWSFKRFFPETETVAPAPEASEGGAVVTEGEAHGIRVMSAMIPAEEYETYGIDGRSVENVFDLSVEYVPADTTYQETTYSVAFKNPSSAWATGKNVTDYVTLTQTATGSKTATLSVLKPFSETIILTAQSNRTPSVKATRNIEYVGRFDQDVYYEVSDIGCDVEIEEIDFSSGTLCPDRTNAMTITFFIPNYWITKMAEKGYTLQSTVSKTFTPPKVGDGAYGIYSIENILNEACTNIGDWAKYWQELSRTILGDSKPSDLAGSDIFSYELVSHRTYNGVSYGDYTIEGAINLRDWTGFEVVATGIAMDTTPIIAG